MRSLVLWLLFAGPLFLFHFADLVSQFIPLLPVDLLFVPFNYAPGLRLYFIVLLRVEDGLYLLILLGVKLLLAL